MPTNREVLDDGPPAPAMSEDNTGPAPEVVQYGLAFAGVLNAQYGTALVQLPVVTAGIAVAGDAVVLPEPGAVIAVHATAGAVPGAKTIGAAAPLPGEVQVDYDADYLPTLTFAAGEATTITVVQLQVPAELLAHLAAEASSEVPA